MALTKSDIRKLVKVGFSNSARAEGDNITRVINALSGEKRGDDIKKTISEKKGKLLQR
jgi:hypothetical protein